MANIEDRIVRMEFDNAAFERKLAGTIRSLGQLDAAMKFPNAGSGLTQVSDAASKFHLSGMTTAISSVSAGFLAMSTIAVTALSTIVSKAISAGAEIVKALAINPVMDGFAEYELNMRSIQTILSNTTQDNTNLEQVNAALDQLNEYSDKTIYNFGEMARNIGTFTAAGVDLDTSVQSIKGIANLAAISGSTSEQARTIASRDIFTIDRPIDRSNLRTASAEVIHALAAIPLERCRAFVEERKKLSDKTLADLLPLLGISAGDAALQAFIFTNPSIVAVESEGRPSESRAARRVKGVVRLGGAQGFELLRWLDRETALPSS